MGPGHDRPHASIFKVCPAVFGWDGIFCMGCVVNGPGEAREADLGIAGGKGEGLIFRKGEIIKKVPEDKLLEAFQEELYKLISSK